MPFYVARIFILHTVHLGTHQLINYWKFLTFKTTVCGIIKVNLVLYWENVLIKNIYLTGKIPVNGKLTTYLFLKTNFKLEKYLTLVKKYEYRKSICKLRTSAHRLFIETGRYTNIPKNERICKNCTNQETEDETHFLTRCPKFSGERDDLFNFTSAKVKTFYQFIW